MADRPMMEWTLALFRRPGLGDLSFLPDDEPVFSGRAFEDVSRFGVMMARAAAAQDDGASEVVDRAEAFPNDSPPITNACGALAQRIPIARAGA